MKCGYQNRLKKTNNTVVVCCMGSHWCAGVLTNVMHRVKILDNSFTFYGTESHAYTHKG